VAPDQMTLDGGLDSWKLHIQLKRMDQQKFPLINRGFHWIQDYPFNR
jgi:hypothetical protein